MSLHFGERVLLCITSGLVGQIHIRFTMGSSYGPLVKHSVSTKTYLHSQHSQVQKQLEVGLSPLTVTPSDPLVTLLFSIPPTLSSADLEIILTKEGILPPVGTTMIPFRLRLPPGQFGTPLIKK